MKGKRMKMGKNRGRGQEKQGWGRRKWGKSPFLMGFERKEMGMKGK